MPEAPTSLTETVCADATPALRTDDRHEGHGWLNTSVRVRSVLSRYSDTLAQQVLTAGLGAITGVLAARLLGPRGRGELAAVTLWPITLLLLATFGMDRATVFFAGKSRNDSSVATSCLAVIGAQSLIVILAGLLVIPAALKGYSPAVVRLGIAFLLGAPLIQTASLGANLLLGCLHTTSYNLARATIPACYAAGLVALFVLHTPNVAAIVLAQMAGYGISTWLVVRLVLRRLRPNWNWSGKTMKGMLKYGAKTSVGDLTSFMNQRLDQLLISMLLPSAQLGIYVAAVAFSDGLLIIPRGIGVVTLASGSNSDHAGAWRWARRSMALAVLWLVPAAAALWVVCPYLITHLFGTAFAPSVLPCRILILGSCAVGLSAVLGDTLRSVNRPEIPSYAESAGLIATVALLALLLKPYGIIGAAWASTGAYSLAFGVAAAYAYHLRRAARAATERASSASTSE